MRLLYFFSFSLRFFFFFSPLIIQGIGSKMADIHSILYPQTVLLKPLLNRFLQIYEKILFLCPQRVKIPQLFRPKQKTILIFQCMNVFLYSRRKKQSQSKLDREIQVKKKEKEKEIDSGGWGVKRGDEVISNRFGNSLKLFLL